MEKIRSVKGVTTPQDELPKSIVGLLDSSDFYTAYTEKKRSQSLTHYNDPVELNWVIDKHGTTICCGDFSHWSPGIADSIRLKEYRLHQLRCYNDMKDQSLPELRITHPPVRNHVGGYEGAQSNRFQNDSKFIDGISWHVETAQNGKKRMEDKYAIVNNFHGRHRLTGTQEVFFGIYDGHGGEGMAYWLEQNLQDIIAQRLLPHSELRSNVAGDETKSADIENAIRQGFLDAEEEWLEKQKLMYMEYEAKHAKKRSSDNMFDGFDHSGAVGCVAIVSRSEDGGADLYIGNVGDCEAVLCRDGKGILVSKKHSPSDIYEKERIEKAGGHIEIVESSTYVGEEGNLFETSRSFGDLVGCENELSVRKVKGLCCDPYVKKYKLQPTDEFLLLGCDGIWDVFKKKQEVISVVRNSLRRDNDTRKAALQLVQTAKRKNATDNLSIIVVGFGALDPNNPGKRVIVKPHKRSMPRRFYRGIKPKKETTENVYEGFYDQK